VRNTVRLLDLHPRVAEAVTQGQIGATLASKHLAKLPREEQVPALTKLVASGRTKGAAAADAVRRIREGRTEGPAPSRMMARRGIEELRRQLSLEFDRQRNMHNHFTGKYTVLADQCKKMLDEGNEPAANLLKDEMRKVQQETDGAVIKMYLAEGGMNAMTYIINHEDFKLAPISLESITRLEYIEGEHEAERLPNDPVPAG